jgi:hypothetical protein
LVFFDLTILSILHQTVVYAFNFLILNLSIWNLCDHCLLSASLSLTFAITRQLCHNLLPWTIRYQVHLDAVTYLSEYGRSDFYQESPSKFMNVMMWEQHNFDCVIFGCGKVYYSNSICATNLV